MTEMSPAETVFFAALAKVDPAERAAYLDEACGADTELRRCVDRLLAAHPQVGSFLRDDDVAPTSSPAGVGPEMSGGPTVELPITERPGTVIGPYKLLQQIGEGGMGTVFMAEQTQPVQRKVALKVIKPGMDSRQVIARFEAERQALAMMDHVNIARVLDAGATEAGRPYFVMELVHGVPITKYCDDNHLTPRERLELFVPVCQAIQHAHQKGIIHRDIKPSNVMVTLYDGKPVPKVIDFGVAKATEQKLTERTLFTQYGTMVGTLEYMSPEQAEMSALGVDTRSDIYSLGVLLYELLTGSTPLSHKRVKEAAYAEILRMIKEEEPPKPSTRLSDSGEALASISAQRHMEPAKLTKLVRGELDWIVMKTLEKDRNRRYETANGFAADVQRYLADEPVQACPPSAGYRLRKFARRNKAALGDGVRRDCWRCCSWSAASAGWCATARAREQEIARERATRQARDQGTGNAGARGSPQASSGGPVDRRPSMPPNEPRRLAATGEAMKKRTSARGKSLATCRCWQTWKTSGCVRHKTKRALTSRRRIAAMRGPSGNMGLISTRWIATKRQSASGLGPIRYELAVFLDSWSHVRRRLAQPGSKQFGKDWRELLEVARAADPDPWRDRFRKAVLNNDRKALVELAASAPISSLPVETVDRLGDALLGKGTIEEAAAFLKKGQRLHPQDYWINVNLAICLLRLRPRQLDDAIRYYTAAVALRPENAGNQVQLGYALGLYGKLDEAIAVYKEAIRRQPDNAYLPYAFGCFLRDIKRDYEGAIGWLNEGHQPRPEKWQGPPRPRLATGDLFRRQVPRSQPGRRPG